MADVEPSVVEVDGRDEHGRFTAGHKFAKGGNHYQTQMAAYRAAVYGALTAEDMRQVARSMVDKAKGGDVNAAKLVLGYAGLQSDHIENDQSTALDVIKAVPLEYILEFLKSKMRQLPP